MPKYHKREPSGWDPIADWYDSWVGAEGSEHHRRLAIPSTLDLLNLKPGEHLLDLGAGQGVFAPYVSQLGTFYTGIEVSPRLLKLAQQRHRAHGRFLQGDARRLHLIPSLKPQSFDAAVFLLSIQDINPLESALGASAWALREGGRLVILMTHPCFRVPRQSGWGEDRARHLRFRRIDHYLSPLTVPMKAYGKDRSGVSISFHRPLHHYINGLAGCGLFVDQMEEIITFQTGTNSAEKRANAEIPLFMALRAYKWSHRQ